MPFPCLGADFLLIAGFIKIRIRHQYEGLNGDEDLEVKEWSSLMIQVTFVLDGAYTGGGGGWG